ncbi:MAG: hypothetical protein EOP08_12585 [Proteobacteria bacterium]|nr:MAG: hypothetical protein EOP08_12585 [Pseudomonadota bacterium]
MAAHPRTVARVLEETGAALGIDLAGMIRGDAVPRAFAQGPARLPSASPPGKPTSTGFPPPPATPGSGGTGGSR